MTRALNRTAYVIEQASCFESRLELLVQLTCNPEGQEVAAQVKIIDFGFSTIVPPGKKLKVFCGTPSYMAPEIVARKEYTGASLWAVDVQVVRRKGWVLNGCCVLPQLQNLNAHRHRCLLTRPHMYLAPHAT